MSLETMLGIEAQELEIEFEAGGNVQHSRPFQDVGFLGLWEIQSQVATVAFFLLLTFLPIWAVIACMVAWSLIATVVYYRARQRGLPDLLETRWEAPPVREGGWSRWFGATGLSMAKAWMAGVQPFIYTRVAGPILSRPVMCWRGRLARVAIVAVGCTLFGASTAHHLIQRAGVPRASVLRYSLIGPFLNVPYRVLLGALVLHVIVQVSHTVTG